MAADRRPDAEYQYPRATVRIYGAPPTPERLTDALQKFMREVEAAKARASIDVGRPA